MSAHAFSFHGQSRREFLKTTALGGIALVLGVGCDENISHAVVTTEVELNQ